MIEKLKNNTLCADKQLNHKLLQSIRERLTSPSQEDYDKLIEEGGRASFPIVYSLLEKEEIAIYKRAYPSMEYQRLKASKAARRSSLTVSDFLNSKTHEKALVQ